MNCLIKPLRLTPLLLFLAGMLTACGAETEAGAAPTDAPAAQPLAAEISLDIREFNDDQYPDNPDIGFRSAAYSNQYFQGGKLLTQETEGYTFEFYGQGEAPDTIRLEGIDLSEFMPTIPAHIRPDSYLTEISLINQEFNRNQVRFLQGEFSSAAGHVVRADLARNCLNSYLWEIILYRDSAGQTQTAYHGWFDFPHDLYAQLFEEKNGIPFDRYRGHLEDWVDLESAPVDLERLRKPLRTLPAEVEDLSDAMYPLAGARKKKFKEVIYPETFATMRDLQTDSALFATFTPPGFYDRSNPKTTQLGRFHQLQSWELSETLSEANQDTVLEIRLTFTHRDGEKTTQLLIGGLDLSAFPELPEAEANSGWKNSMGIGNHSFYETYPEHQAIKAASNPYFALLLDGEGKFLDSHNIGVDGPIFHRDPSDPDVLHLWLLSFERHALVGHYRIQLTEGV